jgi:hypothetical protein
MKDFTLYPEALELRELGFDEPCFAVYSFKKLRKGTFSNLSSTDDTILAPTFSQAFRWFREKHNLHHMLNPFTRDEIIKRELVESICFGYAIQDKVVGRTDFKTHEEAELACLKKLIEIVNEQQ